MRVKIAALRDWTDSPFLKFTLVAAPGEFAGVYLARPEHLWLSGFGWWMHRAARTHTPVAVRYRRTEARLLGERSGGRKGSEVKSGETLSKVRWGDSAGGHLTEEPRVTNFHSFFWSREVSNLHDPERVSRGSEDGWGRVGRGQGQVPALHLGAG